ncbi:MAG: hypothetical protein H0W72_03700, partial [Planctomycetes bacterium]|nr:hypothetical protein [Planctomycetota bacterium]
WPVSVPFGIAGTASAPGDYTASPVSPLVFAPGETQRLITISVVDDALDEADETVVVTLGAPSNASLGAIVAHTCTIGDNDAPPSVGVTPAQSLVAEAAGVSQITVSLDAPSALPISVPVTVTGSASGAGDDYTIAEASPLVFAPGETVRMLTITAVQDALDEADETLVLTLGAPTNATLGAITAHVCTIVDDDTAPTVSFSPASATISETAGTSVITVTLSSATLVPVTVPYALSGSATAGSDYMIAPASLLVFAAGETSKSITITALDDPSIEGDETAVVTMGALINAIPGASTVHLCTITDNDAMRTVTIAPATASITEAGGVSVIVVSLSSSSPAPVLVPFMLAGSAGNGADFTVVPPGSMTFAPGQTSKSITITAVDDGLIEGNESVVLTLLLPLNATLGENTVHTCTIIDDDAAPPAPLVGFANASSNVSERGGTQVIGIQLDRVASVDVGVDYQIGGTAVRDVRFAVDAYESRLVIPAGETAATLTIRLLDTQVYEGEQTLSVTLSNPSGAILGIPVHVMTIVDDEVAAPTIAPAGGVYVNPTAVMLTGKPPGAAVWYTVGSSPADPGPGVGQLATGPVLISASAMIKAVTVRDAGLPTQRVSPVASATFVIVGPDDVSPVNPGDSVSTTSPYCFEVRAPTVGTAISVDIDGAIANGVVIAGGHLAYADVPLPNDRPATITAHVRGADGERTVSQTVSWQATDLAGKHAATDQIAIRVGDSLLLTCTSATTVWSLDAAPGGSCPVAAGSRLAQHFPNPGLVTLTARTENGSELGSLSVDVVSVPFAAELFASEVTYARSFTATVLPATALTAVNFVAADPTELTVTDITSYAGTATMTVKPLERGLPLLLARLGDGGPIIAAKPITGFEIIQPDDRLLTGLPLISSMGPPSSNLSGNGVVFVRPFVPGLEFDLSVGSGATISPATFTAGSMKQQRTGQEATGSRLISFTTPRDSGMRPLPLTWTVKAFQRGPLPPGGGIAPRIQVSGGLPHLSPVHQVGLLITAPQTLDPQSYPVYLGPSLNNADYAPMKATPTFTQYPQSPAPLLQSYTNAEVEVTLQPHFYLPDAKLLSLLTFTSSYQMREEYFGQVYTNKTLSIDDLPLSALSADGLQPFQRRLIYYGGPWMPFQKASMSGVPNLYLINVNADLDEDGEVDVVLRGVAPSIDTKVATIEPNSALVSIRTSGLIINGRESSFTEYFANQRDFDAALLVQQQAATAHNQTQNTTIQNGSYTTKSAAGISGGTTSAAYVSQTKTLVVTTVTTTKANGQVTGTTTSQQQLGTWLITERKIIPETDPVLVTVGGDIVVTPLLSPLASGSGAWVKISSTAIFGPSTQWTTIGNSAWFRAGGAEAFRINGVPVLALGDSSVLASNPIASGRTYVIDGDPAATNPFSVIDGMLRWTAGGIMVTRYGAGTPAPVQMTRAHTRMNLYNWMTNANMFSAGSLSATRNWTTVFPVDSWGNISAQLDLTDGWQAISDGRSDECVFTVPGASLYAVVHRTDLGPPSGIQASTSVLGGHGTVTLASGNLFLAFPIKAFATPTLGPDVVLYYNAKSYLDVGYGHGWRTNYDLRYDGGYLVDVTSETIAMGRHIDAVAGGHPAIDITDRLDQEKDGRVDADWKSGERFRINRHDNRLHYCNADGWLVRLCTLRGDEITIERDPDSGHAISAADTRGRSVALAMADVGSGDGGFLRSIADSRSGRWDFTYDGQGRLASAAIFRLSAELGQFSHGSSRLTSTILYDATHRVLSVTCQEAPQFATTIQYAAGATKLTVTDQLGGRTIYDSSGAISFSGTATLDYRDAADIRHRATLDLVEGLPHIISWIGPGTPTSVPSDMRQRREQFFDRLGNVTKDVVYDAVDHQQVTTRVYTDLRDQDPTIRQANLLSEVRVLAVAGIDGSQATRDLVTTYEYVNDRAKRGLVERMTDPAGVTTAYQYNANGFLAGMTDARHEQWTYANHTAWGQSQLDTAPGSPTRSSARTWREDGMLRTVTDVEARLTTTYEYDGQSRLSQITHPGIATPEMLVHDPMGNLLTRTDVEGLTTAYRYDVLGRVTSLTASGQAELATTYSANGALDRIVAVQTVGGIGGIGGVEIARTETDLAGRLRVSSVPRTLVDGAPGPVWCTTTYAYDPVYGWSTTVTDPRGKVTEVTARDLVGRVTEVRAPFGKDIDATGPATPIRTVTAKTAYNGLGWVLTTTDPENRVATMRYSPRGEVVLTINPAGGWVRTEPDANGEIVTVQPQFGAPERFDYTANGVTQGRTDVFGKRTATVQGPATNSQASWSITGTSDVTPGIVTTTTLDPRGYIASTVIGRGPAIPGGAFEMVAETTIERYDDGSLHTAKTTGRGLVTRLRNPVHLRTSATTQQRDPNGGAGVNDPRSTIDYNPIWGIPAAVTDPRKRKLTPVISPVGEVNSATDNGGVSGASATIQAVLERDANGNVKRYTDGADLPTVQTFYDDGRLHTRTTSGVTTTWTYWPAGSPKSVAHGGVTTQYVYNALGQAEEVTTSGRSPRTARYDCLGLLLDDSDGAITRTLGYNPMTRQLLTVSESSGKVTTFTPDDRGRIVDVSDNRGGGMHYAFNDLNEVREITYRDNTFESFTYWPSGAVHTHTDRAQRTVTNAYDGVGALSSKRYESTGATVSISHELPASGGEITRRSFSATEEVRVKDRRGRLAELHLPGQDALAYTYDGAGKLLTAGDVTRDYDSLGRLWQLADPTVGMATFTYDASGRVQTASLPNGVVRTFGYDAAGQLTSMDQAIGGAIEGFSAKRDGQGRIIEMTDPDGKTTFAYDAAGRLYLEERQGGGAAAMTQYAYDASDNRAWVVRFPAPQLQALSFADEAIPSEIVAQVGTWVATGGALVASGADPRATFSPVAPPQVACPRITVRVLPTLPAAAQSAWAGVRLDAASVAYRAGWQRLPPMPGEFSGVERGQLLVQRVVAGVTTDLAVSLPVADVGIGTTVCLTLWPDERLTLTLDDGTRLDVPCPGIGSAQDLPDLALEATAVGGAASATFDDLTWQTSAERRVRHSDFNLFNQLLAEDETSTLSGVQPVRTEYTYNPQGQVTDRSRTVGSEAPELAHYVYDELDRMTSAEVGGITSLHAYVVDSWRRASTTVGGTVTAFTYDEAGLVSRRIGAFSTRYLRHGNVPLAEGSGGNTLSYSQDLFGNVTGLVGLVSDPQDPEVGLYRKLRMMSYDAHGVGTERVRVTGVYQAAGAVSAGPRYRGMWFDGGAEGMYKTQTRYYQPGVGRFTQSDPAQAGNNWYAYCGGDPVNRADPSGLDWVEADGGLVYWVFDDPSGNVLGRAPIATSSDGITADFSHSRINLAGHNNFNIQGLSAMARDVHLAYEQFPAAAVQQSIKQMASGTFYQGGFGGSVEEARSTWLNYRIVAADGLTFGLIDALHADANKVIAAKAQEGDWNGFVWGASRGLGNVSGAAGATAVVLATGGTVIQALPAAAAVPTTLLLNAPTVTTALAWTGSAAGLGFATKSGYDTVQSFANGDSAGAGQNFVTTLALLPAAKPGLALAGRGANFTGGYVADAYRGMRLG